MELTVVWYLRMSVIYFVVGTVIGFGLLLWPAESGYYIPVHVHLNLLGFMSMMIYGVGYHILPKFSGQHIYSPAIMKIQFWVANIGLVGMALSWPLFMREETAVFSFILTASAFLSVVAAVLFAFNMLKTVKSI
jgi:cytochrome c oxidase cbb3-type subunit 1